jgi:hypothetical protein
MQQQQQQQYVALPDYVLQLAVVYLKLWQQIIESTNITNSRLRQSILSGSNDLLLTVQPVARLAAAVLLAVPRDSAAWLGALAAGDLVIDALAKEVSEIGSDPARIPLPIGAAAGSAAAAESGSSDAPQQQQQQHWEQVLFDPAVLQVLLAVQAANVRHLWHLSNNAGAGSNQAAAVHLCHEELLTAMGVPAAGEQQQHCVWDPELQEFYALRAVGDTLVITRFQWRRLLLLLQKTIGSSSSSESAGSTSLHAEQQQQKQQRPQQQQQQQQQQHQIPEFLLPLLPLWALLQVELLLLADQLWYKFVTLHSLHFMLQLLSCLQLFQQQHAWAPTVQALCQPVLLQLLPHFEQYSKQQRAESHARAMIWGLLTTLTLCCKRCCWSLPMEVRFWM